MGNSVRKNNELNTLKDLKTSGFGQPPPRHGLKLLFWFANDGVGFYCHNHMTAQCDPRRGDYGFHHFGNYEELLPVLPRGQGDKYFVVGNLNPETCLGAQDLPDYVREDYDRLMVSRDRNKDRIIVRLLPDNSISKIYITQHHGWHGHFDAKSTYCVSTDLVSSIKNPELDLATYLTRTGFDGTTLRRRLIILLAVLIFTIILICVLLWVFA
ncbi:hypothetical protein AAFF_G00365650 [Aldrovandia affinis]|uniref:Uncharacterized protein n=1 Tax=Aldrovandia affinis TaxID=143900 RepID=A0AAD7SH98_9TELE|nr:hypothetical protein AAFF_G00365650 [Aldrovandia affinis]